MCASSNWAGQPIFAWRKVRVKVAVWPHTETGMQQRTRYSNTTYRHRHKTHATSRILLRIGVPAATATLWTVVHTCIHRHILRRRLRSSVKRARASVQPPGRWFRRNPVVHAGRASGKFRDPDPGWNACLISWAPIIHRSADWLLCCFSREFSKENLIQCPHMAMALYRIRIVSSWLLYACDSTVWMGASFWICTHEHEWERRGPMIDWFQVRTALHWSISSTDRIAHFWQYEQKTVVERTTRPCLDYKFFHSLFLSHQIFLSFYHIKSLNTYMEY